jgi:uncharacterized peroxidase-related enzyme
MCRLTPAKDPEVRLRILDHDHRLRARVAMRVVPLVTGTELDDVAKTCLARPNMLGRPMLATFREVMPGPSDWSPGERELLAAFVSQQNACHYCAGIHTGTATIGLGSPVTVDMLDGWRNAALEPRVRAAFVLLDAARNPDGPSAADIAAARAAGLSDGAMADAFVVAFGFNLINRLADAFGFDFDDEDGRLAEANALHKLAYQVPAFLLA